MFEDGSRGSDADQGSVWVRVYDAFGVATTAEIQLNTTTAGDQGDVKIVGLAGGGFAAVWRSGTGADANFVGRVYNAAGAPVTGEFAVNTTTAGSQVDLDVVALSTGGFAATWTNYPQSGSVITVSAQRFTATGGADGSEWTGAQTPAVQPQMIAYPDGTSLIAWNEGFGGFQFQRFDAAGAPSGPITPMGWGGGTLDELIAQPDGGFTAVRANVVSSYRGARSFDATGTATGPETGITSGATGYFVIGFDLIALSYGGFATVMADQDAFLVGQPGRALIADGISVYAPPPTTLTLVAPSAGPPATYPSGTVMAELDDGRVVVAIDNNAGGSGPVDFFIVDGRGAFVSRYGVPGAHTIAGADAGPYANNVLVGFNDSDRLYGFGGDDSLYGFEGEDVLIAGAGNDVMVAADGADYAAGEAGNDYFYGGLGTDTAYGGEGLDVLVGETGADALYGDGDQDYLFGGDSDDHLFGGAGVDVLNGEAGNDNLFGGDGIDYFYGGAGADSATGGNDGDIVVTESGDDLAFGEAGNDFVYGGGGADTIFGGAGVDVLLGEANNDVIDGGEGVDYVFLGTGDDTFVMDALTPGSMSTCSMSSRRAPALAMCSAC